uniref:Uncharacterized protein n=1 Tax=viral metagenome TaxID=1070528 RepID=A0A6M3JZF4_9ZZZZ
MCLDKLEKFKVGKYVGYVIMRKQYSDSETLPALYSSLWWHFNNCEIGVKYIAHNIKALTLNNNFEQYTSGFHIFLRKKDAIKYNCNNCNGNIVTTTIMKCKFSKVLAKGLQNNMKCVVANERTLLKEVKE